MGGGRNGNGNGNGKEKHLWARSKLSSAAAAGIEHGVTICDAHEEQPSVAWILGIQYQNKKIRISSHSIAIITIYRSVRHARVAVFERCRAFPSPPTAME
jgi:hypothetical protein